MEQNLGFHVLLEDHAVGNVRGLKLAVEPGFATLLADKRAGDRDGEDSVLVDLNGGLELRHVLASAGPLH